MSVNPEPTSSPPKAEPTYASGESASAAKKLQRVQQIRAELRSGHQRMSATMAPTVVMNRAEDQQQIQNALYLNTVQAAIELLLKDREDAFKARADPHLLEVQRQSIAMMKRDMVAMKRPTFLLLTALCATFFFGDILLAVVNVAYVAIAFQQRTLPSYARVEGVYVKPPAIEAPVYDPEDTTP